MILSACEPNLTPLHDCVQVLVAVVIVTLVRCRRPQRHTLGHAGAASTASLVLHTADPTV